MIFLQPSWNTAEKKLKKKVENKWKKLAESWKNYTIIFSKHIKKMVNIEEGKWKKLKKKLTNVENKLEFPRWIGPFHENYFVTIFSKTFNRSPVNKGCWLGQVSFPPHGQWVGLSCLSWRTTREQNFACSTFSQEATVLGRASSSSSCLYFQSKILLRGPFLNLWSELAIIKLDLKEWGNLVELSPQPTRSCGKGGFTTATGGTLAPLALQSLPGTAKGGAPALD